MSRILACDAYFKDYTKMNKITNHLNRLLSRNINAYDNTSSPLKKIKISSNLIILRNKIETIEEKVIKLRIRNQGCINEQP
jgi:hypothetical protein